MFGCTEEEKVEKVVEEDEEQSGKETDETMTMTNTMTMTTNKAERRRKGRRQQRRTRIPIVSFETTVNREDMLNAPATKRRLSGGGRMDVKQMPLGPNGLRLCRWCQTREIPKSRGWRATHCSTECSHEHNMMTGGKNNMYVRTLVFQRDNGICAICKTDTKEIGKMATRIKREQGQDAYEEYLTCNGIPKHRKIWTRKFKSAIFDCDHILACVQGGGLCSLENYRTLCIPCHKSVTSELLKTKKKHQLHALVDSEQVLIQTVINFDDEG